MTNRASGWADDFLPDWEPVPWAEPDLGGGLVAGWVYSQPVPNGLEVVTATSPKKPAASAIRDAWLARRANRASPVLLVVGYPAPDGTAISVCGVIGEKPAVHANLKPARVERLAHTALAEPTQHAAIRFLTASLPEASSKLPGLRNLGLLATHELLTGVPQRSDWAEAVAWSGRLLGLRGQELVKALGYRVKPLSSTTSLLTTGSDTPQAVAVFCDDNEPIDTPSPRFHTSPVSQALAEADKHRIDWVIVTRAAEIRLYAARPDTGVGRKGRAETFVEANLALLPADQAGYLRLLYSADALQRAGPIDQILGDSARFATDLAVELRKRVYFDAVPALARAIAARIGKDPSEEDLEQAYEQVLVILFRLLFVAYAEDKDLLPVRSNGDYKEQSLTELAKQRAEARHANQSAAESSIELWLRVDRLWRAVSEGNSAWGVPTYNGGLFASDPDVNQAGAAVAGMTLNDAEFAPALDAVLLATGDEGEGPVDFRALSVRDFGTIYEGLLESRLSVAQDDLTVTTDNKGQEHYVPAKDGDEVEIEAGQVYLHNRSGVRKATGSYFTKPFAVQHLLDHALEPALNNHIARLEALREAGDDAALAAAFFDFRCADLAMGSAHFLVAAIDRIEAKLSSYLADHPIPAIDAELKRLRDEADKALGDLADGVEIETSSLLRRQVARHCVYGMDLQQVAVELARLAIWVHTFVPGLPLSTLDHNLIRGNSLTGVGTIDDVMRVIDPDADPSAPSLFRSQIEEVLSRSEASLKRLATTSDANKREVDEAREAHLEAQAAVAPARALFDLVTAHWAGVGSLPERFDEETFQKRRDRLEVAEAVEWLTPVHYPAAFPEVFLRDNPGFDCLLGNPPWEKVKTETDVWWGIHIPGIRAQPANRRRTAISALERMRPDLAEQFEADKEHSEGLVQVLRSTFPNMGSGDTDLHKAFSWANYELCREGGKIGIVLPRSAMSDPGTQQWRQRITA